MTEATTESRTPWRAGQHEPGYASRLVAATVTPEFSGSFVLLADVSEFQPNIVDAVYLNWSKAIIIRAAYGDAHDDKAWFGGQRRDFLHAGGVRFLGIYQYIVASQDPVQQAGALSALVGSLRPGERIIGDLEEGTGDQSGRWLAWSSEIKKLLGQMPWNYSGLNFAAAHGIAPVDWVAAYQAPEPTVAHKLWQFTDAFTIPGVGSADCSVFHGTIEQLAALGFQKSNPTPKPNTGGMVTADGKATLREIAHHNGITVLDIVIRTILAKGGALGPLQQPLFSNILNGVQTPDDAVSQGTELWVK
jgi:hypothetical protein